MLNHRSIFAALFGLFLAVASLWPFARCQAENDLPDSAKCIVCEVSGRNKFPQPVAAVSRYMDKDYYFCSAGCKQKFDSNPQYWIEPSIPRPAPDFVLTRFDGTLDSLASYRGKVVLLDFWATWCMPCVRSMPELEAIHSDSSLSDLVILGISLDSLGNPKVAERIEQSKITYPILFDNRTQPTWLKYGVKAIPSLFLVDRNGQIVNQWRGLQDRRAVTQAISALIHEPAKK